jgi:aldehyde dehydrogenase (NAD+)
LVNIVTAGADGGDALVLDSILHSIDTAVAQGTGDLLIGGHRIGGELAKGYYVEPTLLAT